MVKIKSLFMLLVLVVVALFAGCSTGQESLETIDSDLDQSEESFEVEQETPDEILEEETLSEDDDVEIGELI